MIIKIFKTIDRYVRIGINILVRLFLGAIYFILFFPFAVFTRLFANFLEVKEKPPYWIPHSKIKDIERFLRQQ